MINNNFDEVSWAAFQEAAAEKYDFSTCQRPDGSYYGTGGTCRKGSPVAGGVPKKEKKGGKASGGGGVSDAQAAALSKDLTRQIGEAAKKGDKKAVDNLMLAKSTVDGQIKARASDVKTQAATKESLSKVKVMTKEDLKKASDSDLKAQMKATNDAFFNSKGLSRTQEQGLSRAYKDAKAELGSRKGTKADAAAPAPKTAMATLKSKNKKLSDEYERLRGDKSPQATKRRKEIMEASNKNVKAQKDLLSKMDAAAKSQSPKAPRDSSPAGASRRSNAAMNARD